MKTIFIKNIKKIRILYKHFNKISIIEKQSQNQFYIYNYGKKNRNKISFLIINIK